MMFHSKTCLASAVCRGVNTFRSVRRFCRTGRSGRGWISGMPRRGFSLTEVMAALVILGFFSSSILVVMNRCMAWAATSAIRMQAFEVARENMEALLSLGSVEEMSEYGDSEKYPGIKWQTDVETFYEPVTSRMWVRGLCSAEYEDAEGQIQTIELEHWLTNVSKEQLLQLMEAEAAEKNKLAGMLIGSIEDTAAYAGVDVETIEKWLDNGLATVEDGSFVKENLDLYKDRGGAPTIEQQQSQVQSTDELVTPEELDSSMPDEQEPEPTPEEMEAWLDQTDPTTGLTNREVEEMSVEDLFELLMKRLR